MKRLITIITIILIAVCSANAKPQTYDKNVELRKGLTKKEVIERWGHPTSTSHMRIPLTIQYVVVWEYLNRTTCVIILKNRVMDVVDMTKAGPWGENAKSRRRIYENQNL